MRDFTGLASTVMLRAAASYVDLLLPVAMMLLWWPLPFTSGGSTIDDAWRIGLHLATRQTTNWGADIAFTYGPLGFIGFPEPYVGPSSVAAFVVANLVYGGLLLALWIALRNHLPGGVRLVVLGFTARFLAVIPVFEATLILGFLVAVEVVRGRPPTTWRRACIVASATSAILLLAKFNIGLFGGALGAIVVSSLAERRLVALSAYMVSTAIWTVGLWAALGNVLVGIPAFFINSVDLTRGYSDAMSASVFPVPLALEAAFFLCLGAAAVTMARRPISPDGIRGQRAVALLSAVLAFALWKASFVRADSHVAVAFAALPIGAIAVLAPSAGVAKTAAVWSTMALTAAVVAGELAFGIGDFRGPIDWSMEAAAAIPHRAEELSEATRETLRAHYSLEPAIVSAISGRVASAEPWYVSLGYAYPEARWVIEPSVQSYVAYTQRVDEADASFLRSNEAPERIIRSAGVPGTHGEISAIDGRNPWFEAPAATLERVCRYREIAASNQWEVLARGADICGAPELARSVMTTSGVSIGVPEVGAHQFLVVRIKGLEPTALDAIVSAAWRGTASYVTLNGDTRFRLVAGTAEDPLLLAVPSELDGTGPFAFGPPVRSIQVTVGDSPSSQARAIAYEFAVIPSITAANSR